MSPTCTTGSSAERSVPPPSPSRLRRRPPKAATPASGAVTVASTPSRGRVPCGLCDRRMEGTHQRQSNWYRCQFVWNGARSPPTRQGIRVRFRSRRRRSSVRSSSSWAGASWDPTGCDCCGSTSPGPSGTPGASMTPRFSGWRARAHPASAPPADASSGGARRPQPSRRRGSQAADRGADQPPGRDRARPPRLEPST